MMTKKVGYVAFVRVQERKIRLTGTVFCGREDYPRDKIVSNIQDKYPDGRVKKLEMWGT